MCVSGDAAIKPFFPLAAERMNARIVHLYPPQNAAAAAAAAAGPAAAAGHVFQGGHHSHKSLHMKEGAGTEFGILKIVQASVLGSMLTRIRF